MVAVVAELHFDPGVLLDSKALQQLRQIPIEADGYHVYFIADYAESEWRETTGGWSVDQQMTEGPLAAAQKELLKFSGLSEDQIIVRKVAYDRNSSGEPLYLNTIEVGDTSLPTLVLVHGYGGSGALFYKSLPHLMNNFHAICIDIVGMGASSRPAYNPSDNEAADQFFTDVFEKWRIAMGNLTQFYLGGHSFGGYISGVYACKFPQHIKKLILFSPLGVKKPPPGYRYDMVRYASGGKASCFFRTLGKVAFNSKSMSPFMIGRMLGKSRSMKLINRYVNRMQKTESEEEAATLKEYLLQIFLRPGSTEYAIFDLFDRGLHAHIPLNDERRLARDDLPFAVSFIYGAQDWMDSRGADNIVRSSQFFKSGESQMHILPDARHQVFQDNPVQFAELVNLDLKGQLLHAMQVKRPVARYMSRGQFLDYETGEPTEAAQELPPQLISNQPGVSPDQAGEVMKSKIAQDTSPSNVDLTQENLNPVAGNEGDRQYS